MSEDKWPCSLLFHVCFVTMKALSAGGWSQYCLDLEMEEGFLGLSRDIWDINFQLILSPCFCLLAPVGFILYRCRLSNLYFFFMNIYY